MHSFLWLSNIPLHIFLDIFGISFLSKKLKWKYRLIFPGMLLEEGQAASVMQMKRIQWGLCGHGGKIYKSSARILRLQTDLRPEYSWQIQSMIGMHMLATIQYQCTQISKNRVDYVRNLGCLDRDWKFKSFTNTVMRGLKFRRQSMKHRTEN